MIHLSEQSSSGSVLAPRGRARRLVTRLGLMLSVVGVLSACRGTAPTPPLDPNDPQALEKHLLERLQKNPDDVGAQRDLAHLRWMHIGSTTEALPSIDRLAADGDAVSRLSRLVIAGTRDEPAVVQALAFAALRDLSASDPADPDYRLHAAAAEYAARLISDVHGDREGDDDRFVELYDELEVGALPFSVAQPLLSLRAAIARRHGGNYREYYDRQGCVQDWQAGPVEGSRGVVELARVEPGSFPLDDAPVVPLACVVRVWNPAPSPGIRRMASHLKVDDSGTVVLNVGAQQPTRFFLDGTPLLRTDGIDRFSPGRVSLQVQLEAGWHRIEAHTTIPGEAAWVMVRAVEAGGGEPLPVAAAPGGELAPAWTGRPQRVLTPWPDAVPGVEGPIYAPLRALLAVDDALAEGDADRAERRVSLLDTAEQFAQGHAMRARFERADPSRGRTVSMSREVEALEKALELDASLDHVRLRLLQIQRDRGEDAEVERALQELPAGRLAGIDGELMRFSVFLAQGNEYLAQQALDRASLNSPRGCKVLMAQRALARERADVRAEDQIAESLAVCAGSLALRARLAESRGRWDDAITLWTEVLDRTPDDLSAHENMARVLALSGNVPKAREHLHTSMVHNPFRVGSHLALADLDATAGNLEGAREELLEALVKIPQSNALWRSAIDLGLHDDLMDWRVDGAKTLADYRASDATYDGVGEVLILDRSVARVYENGGQRQIVHIIAHLLSKEKLDEYGELDIPGGAELLTLRSIKPDGRTLEPEIVPGKEGVSLRHLEIGDVVEYEFIVERSPAGAVPGYVDVSTFRFQSEDVPYHRSELVVVHPQSVKIRHDDRNAPPVDEPRTVESDGKTLLVHHWRAEEVPRLGVEPGSRHWLEELPSVHVYTDLDLPRYLDGLAAQVRSTQRRNPALRALVRRLTRGQPNQRKQLEALWSWVVENVEDAGDLGVPATATLAGRTGSRLMLLRAMLREAGIDAELWLARDGYGPKPIPGGHPLVDGYEAALLAVKLPDADERLMVLTASKVMPLGYLAPSYRGAKGLRIQLEPHEGASGPVTLPGAQPGLEDRRRYEIDFELDASGAGTVTGTITLQGMEAILWRQALRQIDRDRIEEVFQQAELGWLPGASLTSLELDDEDRLDKPLRLRFEARSSGVGITQDGELVMRAAPMPLNTAAPFVALPERNTGLVVPYAPVLEAELHYRIAGAKRVDVPAPASIDADVGRFEMKVAPGEDGPSSVKVHVRSTLQTGVLAPNEYPELAGFAREVDRAMQEVVRAQ
ncbi:MAG: hypothetical protein AAF799_19195 [Myxococcota bacterium]